MEVTKPKTKQALKGCGACAGIFVLFFILLATFGESQNSNNTVSSENNVASEQIAVVFDLEKLYGKNIDEIRTILGAPTDSDPEPSALQVQMGTDEWYNSFKKDGYELTVTFSSGTRKVKDFFLSTNDPSGLTQYTRTLEAQLNVTNSSHYDVQAVKALKDPSSYTGIIATPR